MQKWMLMAAIIAATGPTSANAGDVPFSIPTFDFNGFYLGVDVGQDWSKSTWANTEINNEAFAYNPSGARFGGHVGYNLVLGNNWMLGLEADIAVGNIKSSEVPLLDTATNFRNLTYFGNSNVNMEGSGRVRLGYVADRFMPYVTGGLAFADYEYGWTRSPFPNSYATNQKMLGWAAGAGLEYSVSDQISIRAQYLHFDFGTFNYPAFTDDQGNSGYAPYKLNLSSNAVTLGMSIKF
jgi:outer membrane immunogenic protein